MRTTSNKDHLSSRKRSAHMSKIHSEGNQSTELRVESALRENSIGGWEKHPKGIVGTPDFFFQRAKLAVFVNGCFWHGCPKCARNVPQNRRDFWLAKLEQNRRRDRRVLRQLRRLGFRTLTVWEHSLNTDLWLGRIRRALDHVDIRNPY
jgi:DNA mismatch endonuclease (patch repair protein)